jgi:ketosteroid isomerase-like protein
MLGCQHGAAGMAVETRELYRSSSGDRWQLARDSESGRVFIVHEPNIASGGQTSHIEIGPFLTGGHGPEHQELLRLIGTLVAKSTASGLDAIAAYEERLRTAMLAGDVDALDTLLADDLIFTNQAGRVLTKAMDLDIHRSGQLRISSLDFSEQQCRNTGEVAIVVVRTVVTGTYQGTPFAGTYRYTRIWRKGAPGWQVIAVHCSAIA